MLSKCFNQTLLWAVFHEIIGFDSWDMFRRCLCSGMEFQIDPEEERKILVKEKKASLENFNSTLKRHTLVLRKKDLMRKKAEEKKKKVIGQLLAHRHAIKTDDDDEAV
ncbi:hypothetical protein CsSME_00036328 [Camellia sinensis var. sinensis]